ncbi:MAG: 1-acyl-sn-glycerol-3-phosphate acyltransferase, partial [Acidiferrobacterales bacterium]
MIRQVFRVLYRVEIRGMEHYRAAGERVLIIANHTSFLDGVFMALFLPDRLGFVINTYIARLWWVKPFLRFVDIFVLDHTRPQAIRTVIKYVRSGKRAVIFPEGRITLTGSLMKVYQGSGLAADRCQAVILPIRIDGAQYTPLSRLEDQVRIRWFPRIRMT